MKDESLKLIKSVAEKLTIENIDDRVTFVWQGTFKKQKESKEYRRPVVSISTETLDSLVGDNYEEEHVMHAFKGALTIEAI